MSKKATCALSQLIRLLPYVLLMVIVVVPTVREPVWGIIQDTGDAFGNHAEQLVRELNWRLTNGVM